MFRDSSGVVRTLLLINGISKFTSLGRDTLLVVALGISSKADNLQIGLAFASGVAGVIGGSLAMAVTPVVTTATRNGERQLRAKIVKGLAVTLVVAAILILVVAASPMRESGKVQAILAVAGLFGACSALAVSVCQARQDYAIPALLMAWNGGLFCLLVGSALLLQHPIRSPSALALVLAGEAGLVCVVLTLRVMLGPARRSVARNSDAKETRIRQELNRRLTGAILSNLLTSIVLIISRSLAAGVPGGAALLALAQRVVGIAASLIMQPVHSVLTPWLAEANDLRAVRIVVGRFLVTFSLISSAAALVLSAPLGWLIEQGYVRDIVQLAGLLVLAAGAANFTGVALRQWLLDGRQGIIAASYLLYLVPFVAISLTSWRGPYVVVTIEVLAQCSQMLFAIRSCTQLLDTGPDTQTNVLLALLLPGAGLVIVLDAPAFAMYGMALGVMVLAVRYSGSLVGVARDLSPRRPWSA